MMNEIDSSTEAAKKLAKEIICRYGPDKTDNTKAFSVFKDDNDSFVSNDVVSMESHNESYTRILKAYSDNLSHNLCFKNDCKKWFFYLCIAVMAIICLSFVYVLGIITHMTFAYPHLSFQVSNIVAIITAIGAAFISSFIIIPQIITEYLFNLKEEENMTNIIQRIQQHDLKIRKDIKDYNKKNNFPDF